MIILSNLVKKLSRRARYSVPFIGFVCFFLILFFPLIDGVGQNWDWTFPLYKDTLKYFSLKILSAWNPVDTGGAMGYTPHLFFSLIISTISVLQPETLVWVILILTFSTAATILYSIFVRFNSSTPILWALAAIINSAIFYKLLAGHLFYLIGLAIYLGLIYYLLFRYRPSTVSAVTVGLLWALSGTQTQFLVFGLLTYATYLACNKSQLRFRDVFVAIAIVGLLHFFWLVHFISGSASFTAVSDLASVESFAGLVRSSLKDVIGFAFSPATFIRNFYSVKVSIFFSFSWLLIFGHLFHRLVVEKNKMSRSQLFIFCMLILMVITSTGTFKLLNIPILSNFYPILREVGHAGPLVIIFLFILGASLSYSYRMKKFISIYLAIFIAISIPIIWQYVPRVSFSNARAQFNEFATFSASQAGTHRVLSYPFFNQYSFVSSSSTYRGNVPMSNSGWDSFIIFSGVDYIENGISPQKFSSSLQKKFLDSLDTSILAANNIRYIYNFSNIYESNYDRFVASEVYENNLSLIKNDSNLFQNVLSKNQENVKLVSPNIAEVINYSPRITGDGVSFKKISETEYEVKVESDAPTTLVSLLSRYHPGWKIYESFGDNFECDYYIKNECIGKDKAIFTGKELSFIIRKPIYDQNISRNNQFGNNWEIVNDDKEAVRYFTLYYKPQSWFIIGLIISTMAMFCILLFLLIGRFRQYSI